MQTSAPERIVGAAIRLGGLTLSMPKPARHSHVMQTTVRYVGTAVHDAEQGFVTSMGRFVGRTRAAQLAIEAEQVQPGRLIAPPALYSEDLW